MFFNEKTFTVFRKTLDADGLGETWLEVGTVIGTLLAVTGSDAIRNSQDFADVRNLLSCDTQYIDSVEEQDELVNTSDDKQYNVRLKLEMDNVLPHVEFYLGKTQWRRTVST